MRVYGAGRSERSAAWQTDAALPALFAASVKTVGDAVIKHFEGRFPSEPAHT